MSDFPGPLLVADVELVEVLVLSALGSLATPETHWPMPSWPCPVLDALVEELDDEADPDADAVLDVDFDASSADLHDETADVTTDPWFELAASERPSVAVEPAELPEPLWSPDVEPDGALTPAPLPGCVDMTMAAVPPAAANAASATPVMSFVPRAIGSPERTGRRRATPWPRA